MSFYEKYGNTLIEAILKHLPSGYLDTTISEELRLGYNAVLEIKVQKYIEKRQAIVVCYLPKFDCNLTLSIFHAKRFHRATFKAGATLYVCGKLQDIGYGLNITQPKILNSVGGIVVNFGAVGVAEKALREFAKKITLEEISAFYPKIPQNYLESLVKIFNPDSSYIAKFSANNGYFGEYLEAIKFIEIYEYIRILRTKKRDFKAIAHLNGSVESWINTLPFKLTKGQLDAISDIKKSLNGENAARRVIMGDVGCGKTMVILASVLIAYPKRSVLMAPTAILARQLYAEAQKFLPPHIKIGLLTQSTKTQSIKSGMLESCDFVIGTHALLYQNLSDFCLVMIDEQHRFGTAQRSALEKMLSLEGSHPHILQFSATPIPRTMAMIESNFLEFSFIKDLPFKKDITTSIITPSDFKELLEHIKNEVAHKHQVLIIYPLVEESEKSSYMSLSEGFGFWQKEFDKVYTTHGKDKNKESVLEEFAKSGNILLATTVVEVGISLPKLSTIVIVGAERLGLATLHQLRGRVSRNGLKGYCFLFTKKQVTERLEKFSKMLDGFEIAQLDLAYRNSGDLLSGENQSGKQFSWINLGEDEAIVKEAQAVLDA